jgi:hypothetical protein
MKNLSVLCVGLRPPPRLPGALGPDLDRIAGTTSLDKRPLNLMRSARWISAEFS